MIDLEKSTETIIKRIVKNVRKNSRKFWFWRVSSILESMGYKVEETSICSNGHYSGEVLRRNKKNLIFCYGRKVSARSGFNYYIYPVLEVGDLKSNMNYANGNKTEQRKSLNLS